MERRRSSSFDSKCPCTQSHFNSNNYHIIQYRRPAVCDTEHPGSTEPSQPLTRAIRSKPIQPALNNRHIRSSQSRCNFLLFKRKQRRRRHSVAGFPRLLFRERSNCALPPEPAEWGDLLVSGDLAPRKSGKRVKGSGQTLNAALPNYVSPFGAIQAAQAAANAGSQQTLGGTSNVDFASFGNNVGNNLTFTSPTTFTGKYYANGLTYDFTGSIPANLAVANSEYNTSASQQAKNAAVDAAYGYLTSLQGLNALPSGSRLTVNLDSQGAPSVSTPSGSGGTGTTNAPILTSVQLTALINSGTLNPTSLAQFAPTATLNVAGTTYTAPQLNAIYNELLAGTYSTGTTGQSAATPQPFFQQLEGNYGSTANLITYASIPNADGTYSIQPSVNPNYVVQPGQTITIPGYTALGSPVTVTNPGTSPLSLATLDSAGQVTANLTLGSDSETTIGNTIFENSGPSTQSTSLPISLFPAAQPPITPTPPVSTPGAVSYSTSAPSNAFTSQTLNTNGLPLSTSATGNAQAQGYQIIDTAGAQNLTSAASGIAPTPSLVYSSIPQQVASPNNLVSLNSPYGQNLKRRVFTQPFFLARSDNHNTTAPKPTNAIK